ncbi:outer membrane protein [Methylocapsa acidiphila]|uniref:outer membrane protein n=1 Tax=Methylocapsa acidiphila TaxID=133552 RepID=UPI0004267C9E|nr:outer membrane beta-barrel protein [Methylocapsa acidiphila]
MIRKFTLFAAAVASVSTNAIAADLPSRAPPPVYIPPAAFTWSGVYLGATAGFAQGFHTIDDLQGAFLGYPGLSNDRTNGFAGGGTLGVNVQAGMFVYGLETDINWLSNKATYTDPNGAINAFYPSETNRLNYLGTVRGRLGVAFDRALIYFTAGLAYGNLNDSIQYNSYTSTTWNTPSFGVNTTRIGWVAGGGVEYALTPNWTLKGEALYADLSNANATWVSPGSGTFPAGAQYNLRFNTAAAIIRAGVNYKFDWFAPPGTNIAKY